MAPTNSLAAASLSILLSIHGPVMQIIKRQDRQGNLFKKINNLVDDPKRKQYRQNKYVLDRKKKPVEDD